MKLAYKIGGIGLAGGASAGAYLLIPSSQVAKEAPIKGVNPETTVVKRSAKGEEDFAKQGYVPLSLGDASVNFPKFFDAYKKEHKIVEDSKVESELDSLCSSLREKDDLGPEDAKKAERWCFKPRTVEDILKSRKRKQIYTIEASGRVGDKSKIQNLARAYMRNDNPKLKMVAGGEEGSSLLEIKEHAINDSLDAFTKACDIALDVKSFEDKVDEKIDQATYGCTTEEGAN